MAVTKERGIVTNRTLFVASGDQVLVEGSWRRTTPRPTVEIPDANSVRIECFRREAVCREYAAKLIRPNDDPLKDVKDEFLYIMVQGIHNQQLDC